MIENFSEKLKKYAELIVRSLYFRYSTGTGSFDCRRGL